MYFPPKAGLNLFSFFICTLNNFYVYILLSTMKHFQEWNENYGNCFLASQLLKRFCSNFRPNSNRHQLSSVITVSLKPGDTFVFIIHTNTIKSPAKTGNLCSIMVIAQFLKVHPWNSLQTLPDLAKLKKNRTHSFSLPQLHYLHQIQRHSKNIQIIYWSRYYFKIFFPNCYKSV